MAPAAGQAEPTATTLVLVRHGESQVTVDQVVGGHTACTGLSKRGRAQAVRLRERLLASGLLRGASALYASELQRAVETAEVIAPAVGDGTFEPVRRCALCEIHVGEGDGLRWSEFVARFGRPPWDTDPSVPLSPGSESWSGFLERAGAGLREVADAHVGETVVIACHGGVIEASFVALGGWQVRGPEAVIRPENTGITVWVRGGEGPQWALERFNDVAHLDGPGAP